MLKWLSEHKSAYTFSLLQSLLLLNFVDVPDPVIFLGLSSTTMSVANFNYCFYSFITYINSFINPITLIRIAIFTCFFNIFLYYFKHI